MPFLRMSLSELRASYRSYAFLPASNISDKVISPSRALTALGTSGNSGEWTVGDVVSAFNCGLNVGGVRPVSKLTASCMASCALVRIFIDVSQLPHGINCGGTGPIIPIGLDSGLLQSVGPGQGRGGVRWIVKTFGWD